MGLFEGRFPYTDFHRLNLDWIVRRLREKEKKVDELEEKVDGLVETVDQIGTTVEGLVNTVEDMGESVDNLDNAVDNLVQVVAGLSSDVDEIRDAGIMDANMLESVGSVTSTDTNVAINFTTADYTDGTRTGGSSAATLPGATSSSAGVMSAAQVQQLAANTTKLSQIGDAYAGVLSAAETLVNNVNKRVLMHDFENGYWVIGGGVAFQITVPASVTGMTQVDLACSISSDPNGPGYVGVRNMYFLPAGTYNMALSCGARAYNLTMTDPTHTGVTSNGCIWAYFQDVNNAGVTVSVIPNLTSTTGNRTTIEAVRII